ncbi:MAG TPA: flagellar hook capping FlgD N-terminal domain-containing protein [Vicinamibacterales bacterium]|nr:flagellar hook capping FlgD N-terminal domain-containing protein [Vicinamibacterales bacterium]
MADVSAVSSGTSADTSTATDALTQQTGSLGEDAFMQLLITQLQNQDPTQPEDSTQFVTQLAQFTSLEKLTTMNQSLTSVPDIDSVLNKIEQQISGLTGALSSVGAPATTNTDTSSTSATSSTSGS